MEEDERSSQLSNRQHASTTIVVLEISHIPFLVNMYVLAMHARSVDTTHTRTNTGDNMHTLCMLSFATAQDGRYITAWVARRPPAACIQPAAAQLDGSALPQATPLVIASPVLVGECVSAWVGRCVKCVGG